MSGYIRTSAVSPLAYERYVTPRREPTLGELGLLGAASAPSTGNVVVAKAGGTAVGIAAGAGAASIATYAAAGSVAGPIGTVVGAIVGLVVTKLLTKQYLNVSSLNAAEQTQVATFNQYRTIAGQAPGRQYGLDAMQAIWEGALYSGLFPKNNQRQCYHEGCSEYPGDPSWISGTIGTANAGPNGYPFTFMAAYAAMKKAGDHRAPEAMTMIDGYFIPAATRDSPAWAVPASNLEHLILYDTADAWLANQPGLTTPYIAAAPYPQPPAAQPVPAVSQISPGVVSQPVQILPSQPITPWSTTQTPATPIAVATAASYTTSAGAATQASLDAYLVTQGYNRVGTTPQGVPIYEDGSGNTFLYSNGNLFPYGTVAQVAASGNAGTGISIPATGLDPQTANIIAASLARGLTPQQAIQAAMANLQAQGIAITPTITAQLTTAANGVAGSVTGISPVMLGAGALVLLLLLRR